MNNISRLISLLQSQKHEMNIIQIADALNISAEEAYALVHRANKSMKLTRANIKILRGGKYPASTYSLINANTSPQLIIKNINRHLRSAVEHLRRQRETGLIGENTLKMKDEIARLKNMLIEATTEFNDTLTEITYGGSVSEITNRTRKKIKTVS